MIASNRSIFGHLTQFKGRWQSSTRARRDVSDEPPLRSELFSADQMARHGTTLATAHRLTPARTRDELLPRLAANAVVLAGVADRLTAALSGDSLITPAGEWLLDNAYLIDEQIRTARRHLPRGYSRELPRLALGPSAGQPRVYDIALETISHGDGRVDAEILERFVVAYQSVSPLKLGELWAIPIMLRLALIENLRRVGSSVAAGMDERALADRWADQMMDVAEREPKGLIVVIADMARSALPTGTAFVAELARRLQGQSASLALALTWIEQWLAESHLTIEHLVQMENQQQAADQVSISNSIASLRFLGAIDWREFVERVSVVETVLRQDPAGAYPKMDFASRDYYRHATERIAKQGRLTEPQVAAKAIELARAAVATGTPDEPGHHVGFYLVDRGVPALEQAAGVEPSLPAAVRRTGGRYPLAIYLGLVALITAVLTVAMATTAARGGARGDVTVLVVVLTLIASSQLALTIVNWLATLLVPPDTLPRMDFSAGIAPETRTLVVIPTMLTSAHNVDQLVDALEVRFLGNRDPHVHFALLTDLPDAPTETLPGDEALLALAASRIDALNRKYAVPIGPGVTVEPGNAGQASGAAAAAGAGSVFYLLHRPRRWNAEDRTWMGQERKRGKLGDLNALLRGDAADRFALIVGATAVLSQVKYVITLDTDTQLPRDAARQFVGAMAHPLNRPRFGGPGGGTQREVVTAGYGIMQPRVSMSLPGANRSWYARLHGGEAGLDPYTRTVSDVYQDVFGEGSFIGKGIYDVDAFERALGGRFPLNRILSHDLLEGCYVRAGLLSDGELYEEFPARYSADVARRRRWIRGDWQLAGWLRRRVPVANGRREANPLSMLSQWKLFDNLRRSLVPCALTLLLLLGWTVLSPPWLWTMVVIAVLMAPGLIAFVSDLARKPSELPFPAHVIAVEQSTRQHIAQALLALALLPYEAYFCLDAIVRTLGRMLITRRHLLDWNPSSETNRALNGADRSDLVVSYKAMAAGPGIAATTCVWLTLFHPEALLVAVPVLLLWAASPAATWWLSRPLSRRSVALTQEQTHFLRGMARRTWGYFETHVGQSDHWLPPDNVQEPPMAKVAHRTSPTNMGLALLSGLAAHDFGFVSTGRLLARTTETLRSMDSLERYRGHFYNWYDTETRLPLAPRYVSTVDSGNLAGHLLTLAPGLVALGNAPILNGRWREGASDTLAILLESIGSDVPEPIAAFRRLMDTVSNGSPATLATSWEQVRSAAACADDVLAHCAAEAPEGSDSEAAFWARMLVVQCADYRDELLFLAPWLGEAPRAGEPFRDSAGIPTLREIAALLVPTEALHPCAPTPAGDCTLRDAVAQGAQRAAARIVALDELARHSTALADMEYDFLFDKVRRQLVIGFSVAELRGDASYYDLLASEARLSTFVAIAQDKLPQESWFALGRLLAAGSGDPVLLSWSGSMFEFLMPLLVMPTYENTLLDRTYIAAVERQIRYGAERDVPWGMSECGYNAVDMHSNYQYRAFGVPGLGLKRGLAADLVVAPYASVLALMVAPEAGCSNLQRLAGCEMVGRLGFFEAIDYTPSRQRRGQTSTVVRSYMAHHQGMSLLAYAYVLLGRPMQRRFEADPLLQATLLLLQERVPRAASIYQNRVDAGDHHAVRSDAESPVRVLTGPNTPIPEVDLLSNGRYHVMVTNAGGGSSRWKDLAVTRWREDSTSDGWGTFCYLRDEASGEFWSAAHQPTLRQADSYEAIFSEGRAEVRRRDLDFETHMEIVVSPEDDIELRRLHVTNRSRAARTIDVTSYAEVVLAPAASDTLHPAFSNLFVRTEILPGRGAVLCTRRPRSVAEQVPWMFHVMTVHGAQSPGLSCETDRMRFIGRGGSVVAPRALTHPGPLSGSQGSVLDPIAAVRRRVIIEAGATAIVDMVFGVAESRDGVLHLVDKYQDRRLADRGFELGGTHSQVVLRQLNATEADAQLYGRLAGSVMFANASLRAEAGVLIRNRRGQSGLWGYAISGDLPIVLVQIADAANIELVRQLVQAHAYWRLKGLAVDLVIWNEHHDVYRQELQEQILGLIASGVEAHFVDRPGGIFVRHSEQISSEDRVLFQAVARAIIIDARGTLSEQINRRAPGDGRIPRLTPTRAYRPQIVAAAAASTDQLRLFNGTGGFSPDGREYCVALAAGEQTPAPWINVLANPSFGAIVSESGLGYTWSENAHLFRLTPWHNDPVSGASGEALYIRDEETGHFWSPTPWPRSGSDRHVTRHGFGYSIFEHTEDGIHAELTVFVALEWSVKYYALKLSNVSGRPRRLSVTGYVEWVLGDVRAKSAMHVTTEVDAGDGAVYARNPYNSEFSDWVAFFDADGTSRTVSGDRTEFIGRNRTLRDPAAMYRTRLSGKTGAGLDPCAAIQITFDLADGAQRDTVLRLGAAASVAGARQLARQARGNAIATEELERVVAHWRRTLGGVQVETPDEALNIMSNGWLMYQTIACRLWGRSGFYQSGGAYGFRDQLQDVMAVVHAEPRLARKQIILCASRQFVEGDVQHWWHPLSGRGVRTHCSDDYLWLPLVTCRYTLVTGDMSILEETVPYLTGRAVNAEDDSYYDLPGRSDRNDSVYQHCVKAVLHGLRFGAHGLPLMGSGDWNDGMNLVGKNGQGESVWLAFFLCHVLVQFAKLARLRDDVAFASRCESEAAQLRERIEQSAWDGGWYRRAYFDDGTPLGSHLNPECQIDSVAQSWAVVSGAGDAVRSRTAMDAVYERLVKHDDGLIQLLDPPFDSSALEPGYIRGYVPGVRENGGQYTHAAIWTAMAFAALGDGARAWELTAMINPVNHARTPEAAAIYKVEPYVVAADVYAVPPHTSRGGWTWYTGSAGWMYRLVLESLLGLRREGNRLWLEPCLPPVWGAFTVRYRFGATTYAIAVQRIASDGAEHDVAGVIVDGVRQEAACIQLTDDEAVHRVEVRVAPGRSAPSSSLDEDLIVAG